MPSIVEATGLSQGYGPRTVVSDVDIMLGVGVFGLVGPSGSGKTTLLRTLATLVPPRSGELRICGRPVRRMADARVARRQIGYLPQQFGYIPAFTVYEFVLYRAWVREVSPSDAHEQTTRAIAAVRLTELTETRLGDLSGGQLRRCGLAQALLGSPRLVLLDEPTAGLDADQRLEVHELVRGHPDVTVVCTTSRIEDLAAYCDQVMVLDAGRLRPRP